MGFLKDLGKAFLTTPDATLGLASLHAGKLHWKAEVADIKGASATFELGADRKQVTLTRIAAGGILLGPAGLIVGGLLRKDKSKVYVIVELADGRTAILEAPAKQERAAREFAAKINAAAQA